MSSTDHEVRLAPASSFSAEIFSIVVESRLERQYSGGKGYLVETHLYPVASNDEPSDSYSLAALIEAGEGRTTEFKSTFRFDVQKGNVNKDLGKVVAKTVAGFLNAFGGDLLIGVSDNGEILGIEQDINTLQSRNLDSYQLTLRNLLSDFLGNDVSPLITISFANIESKTVARIHCPQHSKPVYLKDGQSQAFFVRDGNRTNQLDIRAAHSWIDKHFDQPIMAINQHGEDSSLKFVSDQLDQIMSILRAGVGLTEDQTGASGSGSNPPWIRIGTRRVVDLYLSSLAGSRRWEKLYLVSPWISEFGDPASLSFEKFVNRVKTDRATIYVVTRPPEKEWHEQAIERLRSTNRANIVLVKDLHAKIYTAQTKDHSFAMIGSANFTQRSMVNREIGILINQYAEGKHLVSQLTREAADLYRTPSRQQICKSRL